MKPAYFTNPTSGRDRWMVSYVDVLTILLILFIAIAAQALQIAPKKPNPESTSPAAAAHARYMCKRLQGKLPGLGVLIGLWTDTSDPKRAKERIDSIGHVELASTFRNALEIVHQMAQPRLLESAVVPNPV